ncbi:hypothetical protein Bca4012_007341 [Brassica carinata]
MIKATIESLEGQLCSNEVMVRHELGQRQESLLRFRYLRISNGLMLLIFLYSRGYKNLIGISIISLHTTIMDEKANSKTPKYLMKCYIKRWCKETGVCEPVTGNVQGTELPEECDDDLLEKTN